MRKSVFCKTLAMILSVLLLCSTVFFVAVTVFLGASGAYTGGYSLTAEECTDAVLRMYAKEVSRRYANGRPITEYFSKNNFYYYITKNGVRATESTFEKQPYARTVTSKIRYGTNLIEVDLYEKTVYTERDLLSATQDGMQAAYTMRYASPILAVISFLLWGLLLIFLFCASGHRKGTTEPMLNRVDRMPLELHTAIAGTAVICVYALGVFLWEIYYNTYYSIQEELFIFMACFIGILACCITAYLILLGFLLSIATRLKVGGLLRRTICARILLFAWRIVRAAFKGVWKLLCALPLIWKTVFLLSGISLIELILLLCNLYEGDNLLILWFAEKLLLYPAILYAALLLHKLKKGGEAIAAGNLTEKIDTKYMPADFGSFGETLNHIGDGLGRAVDERLKSERMKTELITNVSHDIKTPLTSIVNYVDLIKKEEPENETMREYIDVLDRQSARLKKLIEDLVEASKASTGNLSVEPERCEIGVLLEQSLGEYAERLSECKLSPVITIPEDPISIMADGKRLWRVFDNLLGNICKYAQPDTRVYITLAKQQDRAVITFRNISRDPLNVSADELMERFVRGDASRNTEGSGLGLSIARSLTELQGGKLSLAIDGDLFKATVDFPVVN